MLDQESDVVLATSDFYISTLGSFISTSDIMDLNVIFKPIGQCGLTLNASNIQCEVSLTKSFFGNFENHRTYFRLLTMSSVLSNGAKIKST